MSQLADFHRAVDATLAAKRLGTPVFVRYLLQSQDKANGVPARLAQIAGTVRDWLSQIPERIYALGAAKNGHVTLLLEFRAGASAHISWSAAPRASVDLTLLGNHGALYHDDRAAHAWEELVLPESKPEPNLLTWIERALSSSRPEV